MSLFTMETNFKKEFDLSCELSSHHYFKSSFARSMAVDSIQETKSLDNAYLDQESEQNYSSIQSETLWPPLVVTGSKNRSVKSAVVALNRGNKVQNDMDTPRLIRSNRTRTRTTDAVKLWKLKQEKITSTDNKRQLSENPRNDYLDTLLMRKEYQSPMDENRRLQASGESRRMSDRRLQSIDTVILQSQVDTLQWQLKQAESSRQMYHAVMEQVVRFLDRVHKNLDIIKTKIDPGGMSKLSYNRVPRSRSVHTVDASLSRASPVPECSASNFSRAKSIAQIEESQNFSTFRDFTWRRPRQECIDPDEIPIDKLSQEAFRLLRTAQSLLNTKEPDLAQRLYSDNDSGGSNSHRSSVASQDEGLEQLSRKPELLGSYNSLIQQSLDTASLPSAAYSNNSLTSGLESAFAGGCRASLGHSRKCKAPPPPLPLPPSSNPNTGSSAPQHSSVSSTEDESGFSSMSSFQEVGLPLISSSPTPKQGVSQRFQELISKSYAFPDSSPIPKSQTIKPEHSHYRLHDLIESPSKDKKCESLPFKLTESLHSESQANKVEELSQRLQETKIEDISFKFQELGLPVVDKPQTTHRRWSSSPAETLQYSRHSASFCATAETLKVLWV